MTKRKYKIDDLVYLTNGDRAGKAVIIDASPEAYKNNTENVVQCRSLRNSGEFYAYESSCKIVPRFSIKNLPTDRPPEQTFAYSPTGRQFISNRPSRTFIRPILNNSNPSLSPESLDFYYNSYDTHIAVDESTAEPINNNEDQNNVI